MGIAYIILQTLSAVLGWVSARHRIVDLVLTPVAIFMMFALILPAPGSKFFVAVAKFIELPDGTKWLTGLTVIIFAVARLVNEFKLFVFSDGDSPNRASYFGTSLGAFSRLKRKTPSPFSAKTEILITIAAQIYVEKSHHVASVFAILDQYLGFDAEEREYADLIFNKQLQHPKPLSQLLRKFTSAHGRGNTLCQTFLFDICKIGKQSVRLDSAAITRLNYVWDLLGINSEVAKQIFAQVGVGPSSSYSQTQHSSDYSQRDNANSRAYSSSNAAPYVSEEALHLKTLGLTVGATFKDIKSAYRKLAKANHPDFMMAGGNTAQEIAGAENRMQEINDAYAWLEAKA